jgi:hypothetical protein
MEFNSFVIPFPVQLIPLAPFGKNKITLVVIASDLETT